MAENGIAGNASDDVKRHLSDPARVFLGKGSHANDKLFGAGIIKRMVVREISILDKAEEPRKKEGRVVIEVVNHEDMLNGIGNTHGGCVAFLIDICSTMAIMALGLATGKNEIVTNVSQSLNIVFHSPAATGDVLRLVNTTLTLGSRALSARTEIWSETNHRLVASGTHIKMVPSPPKSNL
ncbi:hypothetical protein AX15_001676 [Amanita polypyramis BW_CC]|nr:hypothetical protein AX15_001676 [Amanita polypyramis BW_CC]